MRVWDLPIRLFHWLLVILVAVSWLSAEERRMDIHLLSGLGVLGLVVFRLLWGLFGSSTARFASFVRGPGAVIAYLRGQGGEKRAGHNPLGALSVLALLGLLAVQVGTGLFASDTDGLDYGPLNFLVSYDLAETLSDIHETTFDLLTVLIVLHLAAIAFYLVMRRRNLVRPMVIGRDPQVTAGEMVPAGPVRFLLAAVPAATFAYAAGQGFFL